MIPCCLLAILMAALSVVLGVSLGWGPHALVLGMTLSGSAGALLIGTVLYLQRRARS